MYESSLGSQNLKDFFNLIEKDLLKSYLIYQRREGQL